MEANGTLTFRNLAKVCVPELPKDDATGDVTIRYSSPEGLPFSFEWTATVKVDGTVTTTPFQYNGPDTL